MHQKFKYHPAFLVAFYNWERQRATTRQGDESNIKDASLKDIAIAELVSYIFETQRNSTESVVFRLTDLVSMYEERLSQLKIIAWILIYAFANLIVLSQLSSPCA
jgi:hypothetical protein